jgi:hypothetical protein
MLRFLRSDQPDGMQSSSESSLQNTERLVRVEGRQPGSADEVVMSGISFRLKRLRGAKHDRELVTVEGNWPDSSRWVRWMSVDSSGQGLGMSGFWI